MDYFDTHAHLDQEEFDADRDAVIDRARRAGVKTILCVGISVGSSRWAIALAETHREVLAAVGIQPNHCAEADDDDWDRIVAMADNPRVVALGETGLDRYWDFSPFELQREYFDRHLRLAQRLELPVVIHCREAEADLMPMLREAVARGPLSGVVHSFSGDGPMAEECLRLGLCLSFSGAVTYTNKKFRPLRELAAGIPADRILIETDSPYLTPHPLRGKQKRNEPANLFLTAASLAELRREDPEEFAAATTANARRLFRLE